MTRYYHFVGDTLRDGRPVPPDGEWLKHEGPLRMCASGLHAGLTPWDALCYAPGPVLCEVEVGECSITRDDKVVTSARKIVRRVDITVALRRIACDEALRLLHRWPDAHEVVRRYLETGDEALRDAAHCAAHGAAVDQLHDMPRYSAAEVVCLAALVAPRLAAWAVVKNVPDTRAAQARFNAFALDALDGVTEVR